MRGFPGGSVVKNLPANVGDMGLIPGLGRSPGEGKGNPLQYSGLENSVDHIVHGVTKLGYFSPCLWVQASSASASPRSRTCWLLE